MESDETHNCRPSKAACLQCRKVKMKCHKMAEEVRCVRCTRKSLQCDFLEHRRGRKHGFKLRRGSSRTRENVLTSEMGGEAITHLSGAPTSMRQGTVRDAVVQVEASALIGTPDSQRSNPIANTRPAQCSDQGFWTQRDGFRPSDILSRQATRGDFSLQSILRTEHGDAPRCSTRNTTDDDPINNGLINLHVATSLFDSFMKHLNPFISQLDPFLHTLDNVRETSSFLLTAVLAAAAKLLHPSIYDPLLTHAEGLFMEHFRCGSKSTEIIQAILILTYWKKPEDSRAWLSVGHAIRMAIELGWHQLGTDAMRPPENTPDHQARRFRNVERTWLVLFVYDRSISLQTGKPWMIERSSYIESVNDWCSHPLEIANDRLLSAFASLRLITSTHLEMMTTQYIQHQRHQPAQFRSLLRLLDREIIEWQKRWAETVAGQGEDCHAFLIPFYGSYARLLLFTSPLRASIRLRDIVSSVDTEAIWNSCSSALDMLKLVSDTSASQLVYFAQDSVHVMIAYATAFMIKLLVSAPAYISNEMESSALNSISNTADVFTALQAPSNTSCSLQATFLRNVLIEYASIKERRAPLRADMPATGANHTIPQTVFDRSPLLQPIDVFSTSEDQNVEAFPTQDPLNSNLDFANDEVWALIFANAGFNIDQGAFLLPS